MVIDILEATHDGCDLYQSEAEIDRHGRTGIGQWLHFLQGAVNSEDRPYPLADALLAALDRQVRAGDYAYELNDFVGRFVAPAPATAPPAAGLTLLARVEKPMDPEWEAARALLERQEWRFAKTMPENPHEYTLRKTWPDEEQFLWACLFIRQHGYAEWWPDPVTGRAYVVIDLGHYHYWTMGSPLKSTILINRKLLP
jgi:hypothetical protein